jgi:hypothetical protein
MLRSALNREFEPGSGVSRISADSARVSPLLTGFRVERLSVWLEGRDSAVAGGDQAPSEPGDAAGAPAYSAESVTGADIRPLTVLSVLLGREDPLKLLSGESSVTVRSLKAADASGDLLDFKEASLESLQISGLELLIENGETAGADLRSLKLSGLKAESRDGTLTELDSFSLSGLSQGRVGRITAGAFAMTDSTGTAFTVAGLTAGPLHLAAVPLEPSSRPLAFALGLFEGLESLSLDYLSFNKGPYETVYARQARLDIRPGTDGGPLKTLEISGLKLDFTGPPFNMNDSAEGQVFLSFFRPGDEGFFRFSADGPPGGSRRRIELSALFENSFDFLFQQDVTNLKSLADLDSPLAGAPALLLSIELGKGGFNVSDRGTAGRLYSVVSEHYAQGDPAGEHFKSFIVPGVRDADPDLLVNAGPLAGEFALFLDDPRSLGVSWDPEPGFPGTVANRPLGGTLPLQFALLKAMDVTVSVNGRAPMGVVMGGD